jgi:uncharacterized surface protein with fasciclin (FAS1) repeats
MNSLKGLFSIALVAAFVAAMPSSSFADRGKYSWGKSPTILDILARTDGAQAVVAAVLVVDEAEVLDFSLAELLGNRKAEVVLLAPGNAAFEDLLGLDPGTLDGLTIEEVKSALPGLLPPGVGAAEVAAILLKHVALPQRADWRTASEQTLLRKGSIEVADGSEFPVAIGSAGITVNYETTIIKPDFYAKNGVIHFIDTVILDGLL